MMKIMMMMMMMIIIIIIKRLIALTTMYQLFAVMHYLHNIRQQQT